VRRVKDHDQQKHFERVTCSIKASERAKRASTRQDVEKNEFDQTHCKQEFLRIMHRNQAKSRIAQQFRDFR
jgi:hypothetical protein